MQYSNVVSQLKTKIPEFASSEHSWNADLPHYVFGSFALFLCRQIHQGTTGSFLSRVFNFLNEMASSKDEDVVNLLVVSVLEVIADDDQCRITALSQLPEPGRSLLERVVSGWNPTQ